MNVLLYGSEPFLINKTLQNLLKDRVGEVSQMNTIYYDFTNPSFSMTSFLEEADTMSFFSEHKVMILQNCVFLTRAYKEKDVKKVIEGAFTEFKNQIEKREDLMKYLPVDVKKGKGEVAVVKEVVFDREGQARLVQSSYPGFEITQKNIPREIEVSSTPEDHIKEDHSHRPRPARIKPKTTSTARETSRSSLSRIFTRSSRSDLKESPSRRRKPARTYTSSESSTLSQRMSGPKNSSARLFEEASWSTTSATSRAWCSTSSTRTSSWSRRSST